ncbi:unnamed protein product [Fraxinus pennsylvanica]|uniref:Oberon-like PHD finger domain-containing protein n=1 Tax=Fraxinus pennsylvanica TaxID=56036 RepID=A0AAD1ZM83_9LAMI|nr:unnamed protein product [Fraxinus pennsylvanica]
MTGLQNLFRFHLLYMQRFGRNAKTLHVELFFTLEKIFARDSCGLSCHIECALKHGKVIQLDDTYSRASYGKVSEILRYWKKQVVKAKDARQVDVLSYRILLSYRLLDDTCKLNELYKLIKAAKVKLELELGPLDGHSSMRSRGLASRLSVVRMCTHSALLQSNELTNCWPQNQVDPPCEFDLNVSLVPNQNEELPVPEESSRDEKRNACQHVEVANREMLDSTSTPTNKLQCVICNVPGN